MRDPLAIRIYWERARQALPVQQPSPASEAPASAAGNAHDFASTLETVMQASTADWVHTILRSRQASEQLGCHFPVAMKPIDAALLSYIRAAAASNSTDND